MMVSEHYRTAAGSFVEISGQHRGISEITFDWCEEGACCEAHPVADVSDRRDPLLTWSCDCCEAGSAALVEVPAPCA